jgi:hypothetical protein
MNKSMRATILALITALSIATAAASASAVTISPGGAITAVSIGQVQLLSGSTLLLQCNVTLRGSVLATTIALPIPALPNNQIGTVTSGTVSSCTNGGTGAVLPGTYPIGLNSVLGLPAITGALATILGIGFSISTAITGSCLYTANVPFLIAQPVSGLNTISLLANTATLSTGGSFCPRTGSLLGSFSLTPGQTLS